MNWLSQHNAVIVATGWDPVVYLLLIKGAFCILAGVMFLVEPMRCKWKHRVLHRCVAAFFFALALNVFSRAWFRAEAIAEQGGPMIAPANLLPGEIASTLGIMLVAAVLIYDWFHQKQLSAFKTLPEECEGGR